MEVSENYIENLCAILSLPLTPPTPGPSIVIMYLEPIIAGAITVPRVKIHLIKLYP